MKNLIVLNKSHNPWRNLSIEEYLLTNATEYDNILFLWQNENTVVIGKNQNPWKECRTQLLEAEGGKLARRSTGGGAVYHDLGNLNFSFILCKERQGFELQSKMIIEAVNSLGIHAYINGRNDIVTDKGKFSGNAFTFRKDRALHHGTILVDVDRQKLGRYLQVSKEKMQAKGVESVQSRIVNLTEHNENVSVEDVKQAVIAAFIKENGNADIYDENKQEDALSELLDISAVQQIYDLYSSWEYRYGEAPRFDIQWDTRFSWGSFEINLSLRQGIIVESRFFSDSLEEEFVFSLNDSLNGVKFLKQDIVERIKELNGGKHMLGDIAQFIESRDF